MNYVIAHFSQKWTYTTFKINGPYIEVINTKPTSSGQIDRFQTLDPIYTFFNVIILLSNYMTILRICI